MEKLTHSHDVDVHWRAFELRPAGSPPPTPEFLAYIAQARPRFERMARDQYGLEVNTGPFGIDTRRAHRAYAWALTQDAARAEAFHHRLLVGYWQQAQDISAPDVLRALAQDAGLDGAALTAALDDPALDTPVLADIHYARQVGLNGVPALVFAQKYLVSGAQPYDVLARVVEKLQSEQADG